MNKLLIIDDEELVRDTLKEVLAIDGYQIYLAGNGREGLAEFQTHRPQIVLLDLRMPVMGGVEFLKCLNEKEYSHSYSVIMLTACEKSEEIEICYNYGVHSFLRKPVNLFELKGIIRKTFDLLWYSNRLKKEMEEKEKTNRLLKNMLDAMTQGIVSLDAGFHLRMISKKGCQILDVTESEALGKAATTLFGAKIAGPSGLLMQCDQTRKRLYDEKTTFLGVSKLSIPVSLTVIPMSPSSEKTDWLLLFHDVREEERLARINAKGNLFGNIVSSDPKMMAIFDLIENIATSSATVLIEGESGTGKELIAKEIHDRSRFSQGPFHAVNCAAISPQLLESEFFGHEKGAFTGALHSKPGRFELANEGTLFLDEIGEIPIELQAKLLRALQEHSFERVGGIKKIEVNIRVIAATNQQLERLVEKGLFRQDLYYRLRVVPINLPPLRDRIQDIPLLASHFVAILNQKEQRNVTGITPQGLYYILNYSWPGNVRELFHAIEYAFAVSGKAQTLEKRFFPEHLQENDKKSKQNEIFNDENEMIRRALQETNFNKGKTAALLGINPSTLYRKMKKYNIG